MKTNNLLNKKKKGKHKNKQTAALLALSLITSSLFYPASAVIYADGYNKYDDTIEYGTQAYEPVNNANQVKTEGSISGQTGDANSSMDMIQDSSDIGDIANSATDFDLNVGSDFDAAADIVGSIFGQKISETMSYRSVGSKGKYECTSSTPYSTINEPVSVRCVGVPMGGASFMVPPVLNFSSTPTTGGKKKFVGGGTAWRCHHGCYPVGSIAVQVEYNTYEGEVTMGGNTFFDNKDYNDLFNGQNGDGVYGSNGNNFEYNPYTDIGEKGNGSISDALSSYYTNNTSGNPYADGNNPYGGYYDANGHWHQSGGNPYADGSGAGLNGNGQAYDWTSSDYKDTINGAYYDNGSSFNASGSDWASSGGTLNGYYDSNGQWHNGGNPYEGGHYDSNGNWINGSNGGYYDSDGNWHEGGNPYGSDNLDGYFGSNSGDTFAGIDGVNGIAGNVSMTDDITGLGSANAIMSAKDALTNGGYIKDGIIYDADGNTWGNALTAGVIAMEEGSDQLNNVLAQGGWIGENEFIYDANGNVVGYVVPAGSMDNVEKEAFEDENFFEKSKSMLEDVLASLGNANGGDAGLMDRLEGISDGSLMASLKETFGLKSAEDIRKETMTPQQMYDEAAKILKALGYTDEDIIKGNNYDKESAYTEPEKAWDLNRITTMRKNFKIDTGIRTSNKGKSMMNAATKFDAVKTATRGK